MSESLEQLTRRLLEAKAAKKEFNKDQNELIKALEGAIEAKINE